MCELLHTGDVFRSSSGDPYPRGTDGSNPSSSSKESANHRFLSGGAAKNGDRQPQHHRSNSNNGNSATTEARAGAVELLERARRHHDAGERIRPDTKPFLGRHGSIAMFSEICNRVCPLDTRRMSREVS
jgi:hypothetical protein